MYVTDAGAALIYAVLSPRLYAKNIPSYGDFSPSCHRYGFIPRFRGLTLFVQLFDLIDKAPSGELDTVCCTPSSKVEII